MDLTATILDLGDAPAKDEHLAEMDGVSLRGLLDGTDRGRSSGVAFEYLAEGTVEPMLALRTADYKYVYVHGHEPVLFDLATDPLELNDRASDLALSQVREAMHAELLDGVDVAELRERVLTSQRERLVTLAGTPPDQSWKLQVQRDATRLYGRPHR